MTEVSQDAPVDGPGRIPLWRRFDKGWYLAQYPDVPERMRLAGLDDLETYYRQHGSGLGHSPNLFFDEGWYLNAYLDVASHVAAGGARSGFEHYLADGHHGRAPHWLFDEQVYRDSNPDLAELIGEGREYVNGYDHYLELGDEEGRSGHRFFDATLYHRNVSESDATRISPGGPFRHLLRDGCVAGSTARLSWYFDPAWYLRTYPEVAHEVERGWWTCALHHFLCNRTPMRFHGLEWFSEEFYGRTYPDALAGVAKGAFRNTYEHFVRFGAVERRQPHEAVDLVRYHHSLLVQADIERGLYRDAFAHWLAAGDATAALTPIDEAQSKRLFGAMAEIAAVQFARTKIDFTLDGPADVSVIVVMHDKFALTTTALASLRACHAGAIELILVDSGSRDETIRIGRVVTGARIVRFARNVGFVEACNAGLAHVSAPATLFLNNDLTLGFQAIALALARLWSAPRIGAVGGKVVRTNGLLQEAGSIIWRDGSTTGYLRDADPGLPEANFVRDVDFCSGAFLMVSTAALQALGGFDDDYRPAYYEETDLCVRLRKAGYRVLYDPSVLICHLEYGSAGTARSERLIQRNRRIFVDKHRDWLRYKHPPRSHNALFARQPKPQTGRILFIEDRIPTRELGSGFVRSNDLVRCMSQLGYKVGLYPVHPVVMGLAEAIADFPDDVEVFYDRGLDALPDFIAERGGYYDIVWIGRTHNLDRLVHLLGDASSSLPEHGIVLDTEAVAVQRSVGQARVLGRALEHDLDTLLRQELASAYFCQKIIAVNERDAAMIRSVGHSDVSVLGHMQAPTPMPSSFADRSGLLFLGAFHDEAGPNFDSMRWFVSEVLPLLDGRLAPDVRFTIAGHVGRRVDMGGIGRHPRLDLVGAVEDLAALYDRHRVFVAPTRFAGGIPFKLHEAAAYGLPTVASSLLGDQVGWTDGEAILCADTDDPKRFADRIVAVHEDAALWYGLRDGAMARIRAETDPATYRERLGEILAEVIAGGRPAE